MHTKALTAYLGAKVSDIDLSAPLSVEDKVAVQALFNQKHLLVFKDKILTPKQQVDFSKNFGMLETFPYNSTQIKGQPEIFRLSNVHSEGYENVGFYWHQDGSFLQEPTAISIFHMIKVPQQGGETLFTSMCAAYETLSPDMKSRLENLKTIHRNGVVHPLVSIHPVSQRKSLYLNLGLTAGVIGLKANEGKELLDTLNQHLSREEYVYAHKWHEGDLVMCDNYGVAHQATYADPRYERTLHRTTIKGSRAI